MISKIRDRLTDEERNNDDKLFKKLPSVHFGSCKVCNDKASGVHYGVASCEGCKVIHFI
jgi:hypothetical protein